MIWIVFSRPVLLHAQDPLWESLLRPMGMPYFPHKIPWRWHSLLVRCLVESQWFASESTTRLRDHNPTKIPSGCHDIPWCFCFWGLSSMPYSSFLLSQYLIRPPWISLCLVAVFVHQNHLQQIGYPPWKMEKHGKTKTNPRCFMHGIFPYTKTSPNGPDVSWMFQHHGSHIPNDSTNESLSSQNNPII